MAHGIDKTCTKMYNILAAYAVCHHKINASFTSAYAELALPCSLDMVPTNCRTKN